MKTHSNLSIFIPNLGCTHRCIFCDQSSISGSMSMPSPEWVKAYCSKYLNQQEKQRHREIAFFGGSFTAIDRAYMISLLEVALAFVDEGKAEGIRISTRPDAIDEEILDCLKRYGVTAIELGAQSMDNEILESNKRGHTKEDVFTASSLIKKYGFSLGLQMMVGMYGDKSPMKTALETATDFIAIKPDTVRIYPTLVLKDTELEKKYILKQYTPLSLEEAAEITAMLLLLFDKEGIKVIRTGLHSDMSLQQSIIAGPFHPAFGDIVRSYIYRDVLTSLISEKEKGAYTIAVAPSSIGSAVGNNRMNVSFFKALGYTLRFRADRNMTIYEASIYE